jgi:branched-chain amino acid transport system permease protein
MHQAISFLSFVILYGVSYGLVLFLISIGLVLTMGLMRVVNLAHGSFAAIGGYLCAFLMNTYGVPYGAAVVAAILATAALSVPIERIFYVKLYGASELDQVLLTIGLMLATVATLTLLFGPNIYPSSLPSVLARNVDLGFRTFETYRLFVIAVGAVLIAALWYVFERTSFGALLRAAVDNPGMAESSGINVRLLFSATFALGSGLAAMGGAIGFAMLPLEPLYPFKYLTLVLVVVVLSSVVGIKWSAGVAIAIGIVDTTGRYLAPEYGAFLIYGFLILALVLRRAGVIPVRSAA